MIMYTLETLSFAESQITICLTVTLIVNTYFSNRKREVLVNCSPLVIQYTILSNKWGAVQSGCLLLYMVKRRKGSEKNGVQERDEEVS